MTHKFTIDVRGMPDVLAAMRAEAARILRARADQEAHPATTCALREVADEFEVGLGARPRGIRPDWDETVRACLRLLDDVVHRRRGPLTTDEAAHVAHVLADAAEVEGTT